MLSVWVGSARAAKARWLVAGGAALAIVAALLPWWGIGGGPGELPARGAVGIADIRGLAVFVAAAGCILLATVRYAAKEPLWVDRPASYLGLLAVAVAAYLARIVDLAGQGLAPWPPLEGPGFWIAPVGLVVVAVGVLGIFAAEAEGPATAAVEDEAPVQAEAPDSSRPDSEPPDSEPRGRLDRLDGWVAVGLLVALLSTRMYGLGQPTQMYFDESYYARSAAEFLQDWRYATPHDIYEWTDPMLAKYAMAAGTTLFSDDRVTATTGLGVAVKDAVVQEAWTAADGSTGGDRIFVATGSDVRVYDLATRSFVHTYAIPGADALSEPTAGGLLYAGTAQGAIYAIDTRLLDDLRASRVGAVEAPAELTVKASFAIAHVFAGAPPYLLVADSAGDIVSIDTTAGGSIVGRATIPAAADFAPSPTASAKPEAGRDPEVLVAHGGGVALLDARTLTIESTVATGSAATSMAFDREATGEPYRVYVAAGKSILLLDVAAGAKPSLSPEAAQPLAEMPGAVTTVVFDEATKIAHALGRTPDGTGWTAYAIETKGNAVFSDASLPFEPIAIGLDNAVAPQSDREELLAFAPDGSIASVDVGQFAFSWRVIGVLFGVLMAVCLYLLARILFRRRSVGMLVAFFSVADGMLFAQSRIATNEVYAGGLLMLAYLIFAALWLHVPRNRLVFWLGLPLLGTVLGLALASEWVAVYAIASMVMLVLIRSAIGRLATILGLAVATGVLGWQAIASEPGSPNLTFFLIMLSATAAASAASVWRPIAWTREELRLSIAGAWTGACLILVPLAIYVALYIPWAMPWQPQSAEPLPAIACWHVDAATGVCDDAWPAGHTGQTLWDLTVQMFDYHNDLRASHPASSPWWAWPLDLKPVWFESASTGAAASAIHDGGNVVLWWLAIPGMAFAAWQAFRRRSPALGLVSVAFLWLWLGWSRTDRSTFEYHFYTALPFFLLGLAYFLAELWRGPTPRIWLLARGAVAAVLLLPAALWLLRPELCGLAGVDSSGAFGGTVCGPATGDLGLPASFVPALGAAGIAGSLLALTARNPRRLVVAVCALAGLFFAFDYPDLAAVWLPSSLQPAFTALSPTWQYGFQFSTNLQVASPVQLIGLGSAGLTTVALGVAALAGAAASVARRNRGIG